MSEGSVEAWLGVVVVESRTPRSREELEKYLSSLREELDRVNKELENSREEIKRLEEALRQAKRRYNRLLKKRRQIKAELERVPKRFFNYNYRSRKWALEHAGEVIERLQSGGGEAS